MARTVPPHFATTTVTSLAIHICTPLTLCHPQYVTARYEPYQDVLEGIPATCTELFLSMEIDNAGSARYAQDTSNFRLALGRFFLPLDEMMKRAGELGRQCYVAVD